MFPKITNILLTLQIVPVANRSSILLYTQPTFHVPQLAPVMLSAIPLPNGSKKGSPSGPFSPSLLIADVLRPLRAVQARRCATCRNIALHSFPQRPKLFSTPRARGCCGRWLPLLSWQKRNESVNPLAEGFCPEGSRNNPSL